MLTFLTINDIQIATTIMSLDNYIDGTEFHLLKEDDVKAMVPPIGLAKKIIRLLPVSHN